jgi:predicted NUDIX family NTP pyrophosphohydrolase
MAHQSAGLLLFRHKEGALEVLLAHPGGPFWAKKDDGAWSLPKGELEDGEEPLAAARREFQEETGASVDGEFISLGAVKQSGGKVVHAWALRADFDPARLQSCAFQMEWPPKSGRQCEFPEIDRAAWFSIETARAKILKAQAAFLDRLLEKIAA